MGTLSDYFRARVSLIKQGGGLAIVQRHVCHTKLLAVIESHVCPSKPICVVPQVVRVFLSVHGYEHAQGTEDVT